MADCSQPPSQPPSQPSSPSSSPSDQTDKQIDIPIAGKEPCQGITLTGKECRNKASILCEEGIFCRVHSKRNTYMKDLPRFCAAQKKTIDKKNHLIDELHNKIVSERSTEKPFYGQLQCEGIIKRTVKRCMNRAYYSCKGGFFCGIHSKKVAKETLPKDPDGPAKLQALLKDRQDLVVKTTKINRMNGYPGTVICSKLRMRKRVEHHDGFLKVFPNFRHQNRNDGFGCSALSPMNLGPVKHGQPDLPDSLNLENFHQGNKCFPSEVDEEGNPDSDFFDTQVEMYQNPIPRRHKETVVSADGNKNIPRFSVWRCSDGTIKKMSYIESRQFYCNFYERLACGTSEFYELTKLKANGTNLQICGYDGYNVGKSLDEHYLDESKPFGHEMVLYTLLTEHNQDNYPWRKYKTEQF